MALDPLPGEIREGVIGPTRAELAAAVGPPPVLMALELGQDRPQVRSPKIRTPGSPLI
jgi:hypothetical protein